ncbi:MAG: hypothetical protein HRU03_03700 [Nanoarchaeales archaeon]|nr:hypothetical protein [Nanoarchaeales archaeon]
MIKNNLTKKGQVGVTATLLNHSNLTDEQLTNERNEINLSLKIREEGRLGRESLKNDRTYTFDEMKKVLLE